MEPVQIENARLFHASYADIEIPKNAVVITDPPYNLGSPQRIVDTRKKKRRFLGRDFGEAFDTKADKPEDWIERMPNTVLSFYSAKRMAYFVRCFERCGFEVVQDFHWCKSTAPMPMRAVGFAWAVESGYIFRRKGTKHPVNKKAGYSRNYFITLTPLKGNLAGTHCTQKPLGLMKWLIHYLTTPETLVVDPFMGSGTTGVAATMLGREFIGIEKEKEFFDMAVERIKKIRKGFFKV